MMMIQSWIIAGLIVGALAGLLIGKGFGVVGNVLSGMLCGLVGGSVASILFVVSGAANGITLAGVVIAFIAVVIPVAITRMSGHPKTI